MADCVNRSKLRGLIAERGYNLTTLARKCGHSRDCLSLMLRGKISPSYRVMKDVADALEMTPEQAGLIFFDPNLHDMQYERR